MATDVIRSIGSGGDYTDLASWEAALPGDLVVLDERHIGEVISSFTAGANTVISGQTTDATRNIILRNHASVTHGGVFGVGAVITRTATYAQHLRVDTPYTLVDGLSLATSSNGATILYLYGANVTAKNVLVKHTSTVSPVGIRSGNSTGEFTNGSIINCAAWMASNAGIGFDTNHYTSGVSISNCVTNGIFKKNGPTSAGGAVIKNNAAYAFGASNYATGSNNNASYDTSATSVAGASSITGIDSSDFIDAAGGDFHLASGSALIGVGTNLYSLFAADVDGDIRPSSGAWDIGFDHYVATGGPAAELDGDATATATATGTLTTQIPLSGAAAVITTAAGALSTQIALAGAAATVSSAAGSLTASITLSGAALSQALAAAGLTTAIALAGNASGAAQAAGELASGAAQLAGAASAAATGIASLTTQIALSGAALVAALASGDLSATPAGLAGSAAAGASATGALLTQIPLTAAAEASTTAAGGLTTIIQLAGAAASISSATGALLVEFTLSGTALAQVLAGGDLTTIIQLDAAAVARAAASGSLGGGSGVPAILRHLVEAFAADWTVEAAAGPWEVYA